MSDIRPRIAIRYCTQCHWLLRAAWLAQELLSTFGTDLGEVALAPGIGGVFEITYDGETIWERKADGGFPDAKTLKRRLRDRLDPSRDLGHIDCAGADEDRVRPWSREGSLPPSRPGDAPRPVSRCARGHPADGPARSARGASH